MRAVLDPRGGEVRVGSVVLRTPGLAGEARSLGPSRPGMRSTPDVSAELERALADARMESAETIELERTVEAGEGHPQIIVTTQDPGPDYGQAILHADESGVWRWALPARADETETQTTRAGGRTTFVLPGVVVPAADSDGPQMRGLSGIVLKKILKVLVFPIVEEIAGVAVKFAIGRWEQARRPYRLRGFEEATFDKAEVPVLDHDQLHRLGEGRALLLVHGTLSRTHVGFGAAPPDFVRTLHQRYGGRVFGFDHCTLSEDPVQNVERLISALPDDLKLDLDVVCHSRGGLVSRVLAERQSEFSLGGRSITVGKVAFIATPNAGTALADWANIAGLIDTYTNLAQFLPDTGVIEALESIASIVKHVAVGAGEALPGLQSMVPGGSFLAGWPTGPIPEGTRYYALASDFEPNKGGLMALRDGITDALFGDVGNDLVVPTSGVYEASAPGFPITERLLLGADQHVPHSGFFSNAEAREALLGWLTG